MITEERIKELAGQAIMEWWKANRWYDVNPWAGPSKEQIGELIRTIAVEAQEERRKELVEARELLREIEAIADNEAVVVMCQNYFEQLKERG